MDLLARDIIMTAHSRFEFFTLHGIVTNLKDDIRVVVYAVEGKVHQSVLPCGVIVLPQ